MVTALEIELRKLVPSRDFRVSMGVYGILLPAVFFSLRLFSFKTPSSTVGIDLFEFPDVWHNLAYVAQWVNYLLYVIVLQIVTHEYQLRTLRQNIIDGLSPWQYLSGKMLLLAVFTLASTAFVALLSLLAGSVLASHVDRGRVFVHVEYVSLYSLQLFGYLSLAMLVGTVVRKTGMAILAFAGYTLILEPLLRSLVLAREVGRYLPSYALARLVPNPFFGYVGMGSPLPPDSGTIVVCAAYILFFALFSGWIIARQDL